MTASVSIFPRGVPSHHGTEDESARSVDEVVDRLYHTTEVVAAFPPLLHTFCAGSCASGSISSRRFRREGAGGSTKKKPNYNFDRRSKAVASSFFICCIFVCFSWEMASLSSLSGYVWGRLVLKSRETFASLFFFFCGNQFFRRTFPPGIACNGGWLGFVARK